MDLLELYKKRKQADIVIGSRYISGGKVIGWSNSRLLLSKIAHRYLKFLFPFLSIKDATSGMRIASTEILEKIWIISPDSVGFSFHAESTIRAHKLQLILMEVPITFKPRHVGSSKMNTKRALESLYKFLYWKLKY
jgi:dolichol-phosphate mannosyltransferase